jgi:hypothetical protein
MHSAMLGRGLDATALSYYAISRLSAEDPPAGLLRRSVESRLSRVPPQANCEDSDGVPTGHRSGSALSVKGEQRAEVDRAAAPRVFARGVEGAALDLQVHLTFRRLRRDDKDCAE